MSWRATFVLVLVVGLWATVARMNNSRPAMRPDRDSPAARIEARSERRAPLITHPPSVNRTGTSLDATLCDRLRSAWDRYRLADDVLDVPSDRLNLECPEYIEVSDQLVASGEWPELVLLQCGLGFEARAQVVRNLLRTKEAIPEHVLATMVRLVACAPDQPITARQAAAIIAYNGIDPEFDERTNSAWPDQTSPFIMHELSVLRRSEKLDRLPVDVQVTIVSMLHSGLPKELFIAAFGHPGVDPLSCAPVPLPTSLADGLSRAEEFDPTALVWLAYWIGAPLPKAAHGSVVRSLAAIDTPESHGALARMWVQQEPSEYVDLVHQAGESILESSEFRTTLGDELVNNPGEPTWERVFHTLPTPLLLDLLNRASDWTRRGCTRSDHDLSARRVSMLGLIGMRDPALAASLAEMIRQEPGWARSFRTIAASPPTSDSHSYEYCLGISLLRP